MSGCLTRSGLRPRSPVRLRQAPTVLSFSCSVHISEADGETVQDAWVQ